MMQTENIPTYHERRMIYAIYDAMMQRADLQELLAYVARYDKCSCVMRERVMRSLVFIFEGSV